MPTRTINLKMSINREGNGLEVRKALWTTHEEVCNAVRSIEETLLLCRGKSYWTVNDKGEDIEVAEKDVREEALKLARKSQQKNKKQTFGSDDEVLKSLRVLYEAIVPSCNLNSKGDPCKGDAQSIGNSYAGPLLDPAASAIKDKASGPFKEIASKIFDPLPDWIKEIEKKDLNKNTKLELFQLNEKYYEVNRDEAKRWYESSEINNKLANNKAFNKDGWKKKVTKNDEHWVVECAKKQIEFKDDPRLRIRNDLWEKLHLLPLSELYFDKELVGNLWNRLAMRLAVAHLLSWESWNHTTGQEHIKVQNDLKNAKQNAESYKDAITQLRTYEKFRHKELSKIGDVDDENPYKIGKRAIRGWEKVFEKWQRTKCEKERKEILKELQTKLGGKLGDHVLFIWLAEDGREKLWCDRNVLLHLVQLNQLENLLKRKKEYALMTFADARLHPRWACYEAPGGSNLCNYELVNKNGCVVANIPLLYKDNNNVLHKKEFNINLAPSGQMKSLKIETKKFCYISSHQDFSGKPGGSEILFDRLFMENHCIEYLRNGNIGQIWFKLTLNVDTKALDGWLNEKGKIQTPPAVYHFNTALVNSSKYVDKLEPGLRVLSVDMGIRTFASCSVFELVDKKPEKVLFFETDGVCGGKKLYAKHERSFLLELPGEKVSKKAEDERRKARAEMRSLRRDIGYLKGILRMGIEEDTAKRKEKLAELNDHIQTAHKDTKLVHGIFSKLEEQLKQPLVIWKDECKKIFDVAEKQVSARFSEWRKYTKPRSKSWDDWRKRRAYYGGKSMWMIEYLDAVRTLLIRWSMRGRAYGKINRMDRCKYGVFASGLLRHINKLKEDRIKSGSDLIIHAARGYVPIGKGWDKKYKPCRIILFEDLSRYKFSTDRPRHENRQLMKWSHREIIDTAIMQAELYGITIKTTAAGFSSRYHAATGAPGVRGRCLTGNDFENGQPKEYVKNNHEISSEELRPGMVIPWEGGEQFIAISGKKLLFIHADINAAQNLQRRFWTRCKDAYRLPCVKATLDGVEYWYPTSDGKRLRGALAQLNNVGGDGYVRLAKTDNEYFKIEKVSKAKWSKIVGVKKDSKESSDEDFDVYIDIITSDEKETFFRDPSRVLCCGSAEWIPAKKYWGRVNSAIAKYLAKYNVRENKNDEDIPL